MFLALLLPLGLTLVVCHYIVPSRFDGGPEGFVAQVARIGDQHPLLLAVGLFLLLSALGRYWAWYLTGESPKNPLPSDGVATEVSTSRLNRKRSTRRFGIVLALSAVAAFLVRASVSEIYRVVGASMVPTLNNGDRLLVNRLAYGLRLPLTGQVAHARLPRRGDVIVFSGDSADGGAERPIAEVKRVVGLPGDIVAFRNGSPIINGWAIPACDAGPFIAAAGSSLVRGRVAVEFLDDHVYLTVRTPLDESVFGEYRVLPGEVFVIGDDRSLSTDSRAWNAGRGGGVRIDRIEGRVSRLVAGGLRDGRLDLANVLAPIGLNVREVNVDLRKTEERIAACLKTPPASTRPPRSSP